MKLRATHLLILSALLCCGLCAPLTSSAQDSPASEPPGDQAQSAAQNQNPPEPAPDKAEQNAPAPQAEPAPNSVTPPTTSSSPAEQTVSPPSVAPGGTAVAPKQQSSASSKPRVVHRTKRKPAAKKPKTTAPDTADPSPKKIVVKNGGEKDQSPQIAPAVTPDQASQQRDITSQLLIATDANLNRVTGRQLSQADRDTVDQIHTYMRQAKAASASGDTSRAQTLAQKARLLSEELARR